MAEEDDWKIYELASANNFALLKRALEREDGKILREDLDLALLRAATNGNLECVILLLDSGADIRAVDGNLDNALILATSNGHKKVVELLLKRGCPPNEVNSFNSSALMKACQNGYTHIVRLLLEYISFPDSNSTAPKTQTCEKSNLPNCKTYTKVDVKKSPKGQTPLISAVLRNSIDLVKILLAANVPVNETDLNKSTPLHLAASSSTPEIIDILIEAKADVNAKNMINMTPLMYAITCNRIENIRLLLKYGADVLAICGGRNVLSIAAQTGTKEIMEALIEAGADLDHRDAHGNSPLFVAVQNENYAALRCLLIYGCTLDSPNKVTHVRQWQKMTLFHFTLWKKNLDIINILYLAGAYTNSILHECFSDEKLREHCSVKPELFQTLQKFACHPPKLLLLCRKAVREAIQKPLPKTVQKLGLPTTLKDFLLYSDIQFNPD